MTTIHSHYNPEVAYLANRLEADLVVSAQIKDCMGANRLCEVLDLPHPDEVQSLKEQLKDAEEFNARLGDRLDAALTEIKRLNQLLNGK